MSFEFGPYPVEHRENNEKMNASESTDVKKYTPMQYDDSAESIGDPDELPNANVAKVIDQYIKQQFIADVNFPLSAKFIE